MTFQLGRTLSYVYLFDYTITILRCVIIKMKLCLLYQGSIYYVDVFARYVNIAFKDSLYNGKTNRAMLQTHNKR